MTDFFIDDTENTAPLDQQEDLLDLGYSDWHHGAALWSTDWTTETIIRQLEKGNIDLNPRWQRRGAWTDEKQSSFIESLFLSLPVPQLILAENPHKKGTYFVIDGKQRLLSLARFAAFREQEELGVLKLRGLTDLDQLNKKTYKQISGDFEYTDLVNQFDNQTIRTIVIKSWTDDRYLYSVFLRINTGSTPLSPQELRQALSPGPFSNFVDDKSTESPVLRELMGLKAPDFRMRDAELLLRFLSYRLFYHTYRGVLKTFLDEVTKNLNKNWDRYSGLVDETAREMEEAIIFTKAIFGKNYMRKWNGQHYENRLNRAVFDIMTYYFSYSEIREKIVVAKCEASIVDTFKALCDQDEEFRRSLESTTKSIEANEIRFGRWGNALANILGSPVEIPVLDRNV